MISLSPYSPQVIETKMQELEYIEFVSLVGISPNEYTVFSYKLAGYKTTDIFTVLDEDKQIGQELDITIVSR